MGRQFERLDNQFISQDLEDHSPLPVEPGRLLPFTVAMQRMDAKTAAQLRPLLLDKPSPEHILFLNVARGPLNLTNEQP